MPKKVLSSPLLDSKEKIKLLPLCFSPFFFYSKHNVSIPWSAISQIPVHPCQLYHRSVASCGAGFPFPLLWMEWEFSALYAVMWILSAFYVQYRAQFSVYYQYFLWFSLPVFRAIPGLEVWYRTLSKLHIHLLYFPPSQLGKNQVKDSSEGLQRQKKMQCSFTFLELMKFCAHKRARSSWTTLVPPQVIFAAEHNSIQGPGPRASIYFPASRC